MQAVSDPLLQNEFENLRAAVLIPTYNNEKTLLQVIKDVRAYTTHIIVVNDGSSDNTAELLSTIPEIHCVQYSVNRGKGFALRNGFREAVALGYDYVISIDSDGQHFAKDLAVFLHKIREVPGDIIIGARNMNQDSVPGKSSFGNKFSNFWFWLETGVQMPDTQSGYRLYPVQRLSGLHFFTRKYEFEIEVLVRASWAGIGVHSVPVSVYYAPEPERISHFRPFKDFFRISVLNTFLVLITFLYIKPRDFFRALFRKDKWQHFYREQILSVQEPNHIKALSIGLGVFMGILPIWGFQLVTAIFLSIILRLNKTLVIVAANISIPPMIPLIIYASFRVGGFWMADCGGNLFFSDSINMESVKANLQQYVYGSITLAIVAGTAVGLLAWLVLSVFRKKINNIA